MNKKAIGLTYFFLLIFYQFNYAQLEYPGTVDITGSAEVIFNSASDSCSSENIPDTPIRFFRDANNKIQMIVSHFEGYRMIGNDFNSLSVDCANGPVWTSDFDSDPSKYNNKEWLTGLYTLDGKTIYSLVHNEHNSDQLSNWYNSITLAVSNDTGKTYTHTTAPNHLVASIPYTYSNGMGPAGVFEPSNIIYHDGYYYVLLHMESFGLQETGVSIMRTQDLSNPTSWEVWDGEGYNHTFINPYTETGFDPADHIAAIISPSEIEKMHGSITWNTYFNKFLLVGSAQKSGVWGFYYSLSEDLIHWTVRKKIMEVNVNIHAQPGSDVYGYPSIIDYNDTTRNFEVTGRDVYLYYSVWPYGENYNRKIERVPIRFNKLLVDGFVVTGKGDKEDTNWGDGIAKTSSGLTSLRSAIQESNSRPTWYRDSVITISFNISGSGTQGIALQNYLPTIIYPVEINGYTQPGSVVNTNDFHAGSNAVPLIRINANGNGGFYIEANNTTIKGLIINKHVGAGINLIEVSNCRVEGSFIGTSVDGLTNVTNDGNGIYIENSYNNTIGGIAASARNVVLGGISITGNASADNIIAGNYIGTDKTGTTAVSKNSPGIQIIDGAHNNFIGGEYESFGNLISGNWMQGVFISGNGSNQNSILNNYIGTDVSGQNKLPNTFEGVYITNNANNNTVGQVDQGNIIGGNGEAGIKIENCSDVVVQNNIIGTNLEGTINLGNNGAGVLINNNSSNNIVGGLEQETGNTIAFNGLSGIIITGDSSTNNAILRNSIYQNSKLGIDLQWDEMSNENDQGDEDGGPNGLQNFPEISSAQLGDSLIVTGVFYSKANKAYKLQFFISDSSEENGYGEGQNFIGEILTPLGATGQYNFRYAFADDGYQGKFVSATATDDSNNTSEFSNSVLIREPSAQIQLSENNILANVIPNSGVEIELEISNIGKETLNWSATNNETWLSFSENSGVIPSKGKDTITVEVSTMGLEENTYSDTIKITSNDPIDSVKIIPIVLNVAKASTSLEISSDSIWIGLNKDDEITKSFYITNQGDTQVNWSLSSDQMSWMTVQKSSGSLSASEVDTVNILFNTASLQNGTYSNLLEIYSSDQNSPDYSIKVLMEVNDFPSINISEDTLKFLLTPNEEKTLPLKIKNKGKLNLVWNVNWTFYSPWIKPLTQNGTIAPNSEYNLNIKVKASDLDSSYGEGVLIIHSNDPNSDPIMVPVIVKIGNVTGLDNITENLPTEYGLKQNYPNPFNPSTTISYQLPKTSNVKLTIYDILGKKIKTIVDEKQAAGNYNVFFNAGKLPSGIYIYTINADEFFSSKKFILLK